MRVVLLKECLSPSAASMIALFAFHHSPPFGAVRHLLTVAEALHFTRVAQKLYLGGCPDGYGQSADHRLYTTVLIYRRTPISAAVTLLAGPTVCEQLFGNHSIHHAMTEQQNRPFTGKGLQPLSCRVGAQPRGAGGFDIA